jgi:LPXTG-motif cell wall-anchored protein
MRKWIAVTSIIVGLGVLGMAAGMAFATPGSQQYDTTTVTTTIPETTATTTTETNKTLPTTTAETTTTGPAELSTPNNTGTVEGATASNPAPTVKSDSLPFTGASLVWIAALGVLLVLMGLALRRRGRRSSTG